MENNKRIECNPENNKLFIYGEYAEFKVSIKKSYISIEGLKLKY